MVPKLKRVALIALLLGLVTALLPASSFAHERRPVGEKYQFVVGFLTEPAFANQMNGIDLRVTTIADSKPVEGVEKTLKAKLIVGGGAQTMDVTLQTRFGQPGAYAAYFMPTREGSYIFHFTGTIDGTPVDERFESGPGRFNDIQSVEALQFPEKLASPASAAAQVEAARQEAASARLFGLAGLVVGLVGLVVGIASLSMRRRGPELTAARNPLGPS